MSKKSREGTHPDAVAYVSKTFIVLSETETWHSFSEELQKARTEPIAVEKKDGRTQKLK